RPNQPKRRSPETPQSTGLDNSSVCDELDHGRTPVQVASDVMKSSNLDAFHAGYFCGASIRVYCPRYAS
ncbi:DUF732 domain-containing protein, partial [Mycobacterium avium]|uniref:DUF732 domain-containing protein n=1 Tax=Mycobacterium avium TaxID=1764 RepID=UPI001142B36A